MKKFIIEREIEGLGNLSGEELRNISQASCAVVSGLDAPYHWIQSFVTNNKLYCIHIAESEEVVREHARRGGFPVHSIAEVKTIIDPTTSAVS
ncbi:hypothetical protein GCM10010967_33630 [Dyadobacter beijingensis]|uniref:DUF4242 domain-containing protein n=1 Tax=Dyadobacter beijingensis TaxID=365489 RepID=A0ABQ2I2L3_9BACT|nr:DUF4242 domain-containing protein [Dyadobacter beijingensis]GGM97075.1 hypothetical protein GCM10010967_33630 [Dyadobacter beijingensis]